ncbi:PREDICTED: receptor-like protein 12 [Brassica oleracea var. oleracea]|uniref:Uncharacterized protein n=1 Tax=Brassica oleracea var. oleracea TaxID=109376 RepID=A0A0D3BCC9_BRAOL|nr:PREDICTED: receptor-like protein 12 [Brassica oleracea var. oleracea]
MKGSWNASNIIHSSFSCLFLFLFNFRDVCAAPTRYSCRSEQRDALLEFKNEFEIGELSFYCISGYPKTESWANSSDCCRWEGITCDVKSGEVVELDLSCSGLHGRFRSNSSLFRLQNLHFLDLSLNDLSGHIPSSVGNLSHLTTLHLSDNHFSGQILSYVAIFSLLNSLDLSYNQFLGEIPPSIGNLSKLTTLDLSYNQFSGYIPFSIGNLSQLISLGLSQNTFSGQIPSSIGNLSQLTYLHFFTNNFMGEIPSSFGNLNRLIRLSMFSNKLYGNFPSALLKMTRLSTLILSSNKFTGTLPPNITSLSNLAFFDASDNALSGTLPSSLFTIPSLTSIDLSDNQLEGTLEFGNTSSPPNLQALRIGGNNFIGPIPSSISKLTNLEELDLSSFNTQGPVDFSIFSHLKALQTLGLSHLNTTATIDLNDFLSYFKRLSYLDLSGNHVSAANKSSVPWPSLVYMDLSQCGINGFFPELLKTQKRLRNLDISNNKIKGQVPGWLWMLPNLENLELSNNTFTGFERPPKHGLSYVWKPSIKNILGSNNNFTGKVPSFICALRSLNILDLSKNNLNGSIPHCLGNFKSSLSVLNVRHNRLSGGLPENILGNLRSLDVGHNQLTGKLPRSSIRMSSPLEVLNVESNRINDTFPFWLSSLQSLQVLVLGSNSFHGPIHHQVSFPKLRIIDISRNHFNGSLPTSYFAKWSAMSSLGTNEEDRSKVNYMDVKYMGDEVDYGYYHDSIVLMNRGLEMELVSILKIYTALDFSGNELEGEIPRSIGLLKEIHVLNLSNNGFTGHMPSSLGNMTALESLDVSRNKLSGEIPQELGNLSFLAYMNFSHNQLVGLVPDGTQFRRQNCTSFEDNMRLFGPSLDEVCGDIRTPASQQHHESKGEEEVMSWIAVAIGSVPGIVFGLTIGYILASYKPEWFLNPFGRKSCRRSRSTTT